MLTLGFDLSTQQLKIVALDNDLSVHSTHTISLDDCSNGLTVKGVCNDATTSEVVTPIAVFLNAIQSLLDRMLSENFPFHLVHAIGGSAQQHGTVYYTNDANNLLQSIQPNDNWSHKLINAFSFNTATNWQDRSTSAEVSAFDAALGGKEALANATGSCAHYRFSGPQMRRRAKVYPQEWSRTAHISLISTFLQSILSGKLCPIEPGDACGMNLYDVRNKDWIDPLLALVTCSNSEIDGVDKHVESEAALKVRELLGTPSGVTQNLAPYLVKRYGFREDCLVCPITGDNLATVMALPSQKNDVLVSLGTSTTVLLLTGEYVASSEYHMFTIDETSTETLSAAEGKDNVKVDNVKVDNVKVDNVKVDNVKVDNVKVDNVKVDNVKVDNTNTSNLYMAMLCYANGALAREKVAIAAAEAKLPYQHDTVPLSTAWDCFTTLLNDPTPPETVAIFFPHPEIIPDVPSQIRWWRAGTELTPPPPPLLAPRLIVESQALANRVHMSPLLANGRPNRVFFAGGSTRNKRLVELYTQVLAPTTGAYISSVPDLCALGGALRAQWELVRINNPSYTTWLAENFNSASLSPVSVKSDANMYNHKAQLYIDAQSKSYK